MIQLFDSFGKFETPSFVLCNPDKKMLYSLGQIYERNITLRYNALSEISFTAPYKVDSEIMPYYSILDYRRLVLVEGIGYFMIVEKTEEDDGVVAEKQIKAQSLEVELSFKKVSLFSGTYKFYDLLDSDNLLTKILAYAPNWSIGYIDPDLYDIYRTLDITDATVYSILMNEVEQNYQCVFTFDTFNRTISAYSIENATAETDIYISFDNLSDSVSVSEITNELVTSLNVYGGGDLDIRSVNPLGTNTIYDFSYYKNVGWMDEDLIQAINTWESLIDSKQIPYADLLTSLTNSNISLLERQSELVDLQTSYDTLDGVRKARIEQGLVFTDINAQLAVIQTNINNKNLEIAGINSTIEITNASLASINSLLSFENNFTSDQLSSLTNYMIGSTYQNSSFIKTDIMTSSEIQAMSQKLYDQSKVVLSKVAQPRYELELNAVNFVFLQEYSGFINQLNLGSVIRVELKNTFTYSGSSATIIDDKIIIKPVVLEIYLNYDDPDDFKLTLSNRLRLDNSAYEFSDLFSSTNNSAISTNFNSEIWSSWNNNYKNDVSDFITSSLDAAKNAVINAANQEIIINTNGLQGRSIPVDSSGSPLAVSGSPVRNEDGKIIYYTDAYGNIIYSPEKVWLTNNTLAFTKNNWQTASLALGKISGSTYGLSGSAYGLVADVIVGKLIAGNQLIISNTNNKFLLDSSGAVLTDATFRIEASSTGNTRIYLDPSNGIKIQANVGGAWIDRFWADSGGNLHLTGDLTGSNGTFSGTITATSGTIGGWTIGSTQLTSPNGRNWIKNNGDVQFGDGKFYIAGNNLYFGGTISAEKISGKLIDDQIDTGLNAGKMTTGTMSANRIGAGIISFSGGYIDMSGTGNLRMRSDLSTEFIFGTRQFVLDNNYGVLCDKITFMGTVHPSSSTTGVNIGYSVQTPYGTRVLTFTKGILTSYT